MASVTSLFLADQVQYEYVAGHCWKQSAIPYKIAAICGGQQGVFWFGHAEEYGSGRDSL